MKIGIILISYNQESYIRQTIESVISQRVDSEVCVWVADDCSTDSTFEIIKEYEKKSPFPFKYLPRETNVGMRMNYKRAFEACDGDYVAILEGDDWWSSENHLQQHIDFLERHSKCPMSFNRITCYYPSKDQYQQFGWAYGRECHYYTFKDSIVNGNVVGNLSSCVFRTKYLKMIPESFYEMNFADWELSVWMAQFGKIAKLKESTSVYRRDEMGQWTKQDIQSKRREIKLAIDEMDVFYNHRYSDLFEEVRSNSENGFAVRLKPSLKHRIQSLFKRK